MADFDSTSSQADHWRRFLLLVAISFSNGFLPKTKDDVMHGLKPQTSAEHYQRKQRNCYDGFSSPLYLLNSWISSILHNTMGSSTLMLFEGVVTLKVTGRKGGRSKSRITASPLFTSRSNLAKDYSSFEECSHTCTKKMNRLVSDLCFSEHLI